MPGQDQTGPLGQGPMTGRAMGRCNTNATPGFGGGRGLGRGRGARCGMGRGYGQQSMLADLERRLAALESR